MMVMLSTVDYVTHGWTRRRLLMGSVLILVGAVLGASALLGQYGMGLGAGCERTVAPGATGPHGSLCHGCCL
jgi:hypothetical protein